MCNSYVNLQTLAVPNDVATKATVEKATPTNTKNESTFTPFEQPFQRKKRDKILAPGVLIQLMKKSDYHGLLRMVSNLSFMGLTAYYGIYKLDVYRDGTLRFDDMYTMMAFAVVYIFYGFQMQVRFYYWYHLGMMYIWYPLSLFRMHEYISYALTYVSLPLLHLSSTIILHLPQCMAFAGGHELLHGNAFKTRWLNTLAIFFVSTTFFEVLYHERLNHKQHHTYALDIDRDPEITSFYTRKELENNDFKSAPDSRFSWLKTFLNVSSYFYHRMCRLISSSFGIPTDYTGIGWSMTSPKRQDIDPSVVRELQLWSILQVCVYVVVFTTFGNSIEGIKNLLFWWIVPCIIGYGPINYVRNAEHADCDRTNDSMLNTRTVESNFIARWLLWETNFHAEHHAYPTVPFYNLPKLHVYLNDHIKHNETKTFTAQQWALIRKGGWIDKQASGHAKAA